MFKKWIQIAKDNKLVGKDINKIDQPEVAEGGGVIVTLLIVSAVIISALFFNQPYYLVIALSVLFAGFIGFIDDILGWKKGLKQWQKPLLTIIVALPILFIAGSNSIYTPFGSIYIAPIIYALLVVIAIVGTSNAFNMLAGLNGLEAGMGNIILLTLGIILGLKGNIELGIICGISAVILGLFLQHNIYPAKLFGGDSLTYMIGALIGIIAIVGKIEFYAIILFIPYLIEGIIKAKNRFKSECFGIPQLDGTLKSPDKIGSLTHIFMKKFKTEIRVVNRFLMLEMALSIITIVMVLIWK